jgi:hypothetical protein
MAACGQKNTALPVGRTVPMLAGDPRFSLRPSRRRRKTMRADSAMADNSLDFFMFPRPRATVCATCPLCPSRMAEELGRTIRQGGGEDNVTIRRHVSKTHVASQAGGWTSHGAYCGIAPTKNALGRRRWTAAQ